MTPEHTTTAEIHSLMEHDTASTHNATQDAPSTKSTKSTHQSTKNTAQSTEKSTESTQNTVQNTALDTGQNTGQNTVQNTTGTTGSRGHKHRLDKFYTKPEIVHQCLAQLNLDSYDLIIEPSAGAGAFSRHITGASAYDLSPEHEDITQADWLTLDKTHFTDHDNILVIGNPPFGSQGSLAYKFLTESMTFADTIAFILPKGFKKITVKNRLPLHFHLTAETDLPARSFTLHDQDYAVPCVFQIWQKSTTPREKVQHRRTTELFTFTDKHTADFRIQRVGGNAGRASQDLDGSTTSNYFLKNTSNLTDEALISVINETVFPTVDDTTGPRSLSKGELISCVEAAVREKSASD